MRNLLVEAGYKQDSVDCCLFRKGNMLVGVYVDDLLVTGDHEEIEALKEILSQKSVYSSR